MNGSFILYRLNSSKDIGLENAKFFDVLTISPCGIAANAVPHLICLTYIGVVTQYFARQLCKVDKTSGGSMDTRQRTETQSAPEKTQTTHDDRRTDTVKLVEMGNVSAETKGITRGLELGLLPRF